jgi:hypothetical protein
VTNGYIHDALALLQNRIETRHVTDEERSQKRDDPPVDERKKEEERGGKGGGVYACISSRCPQSWCNTPPLAEEHRFEGNAPIELERDSETEITCERREKRQRQRSVTRKLKQKFSFFQKAGYSCKLLKNKSVRESNGEEIEKRGERKRERGERERERGSLRFSLFAGQ